MSCLIYGRMIDERNLKPMPKVVYGTGMNGRKYIVDTDGMGVYEYWHDYSDIKEYVAIDENDNLYICIVFYDTDFSFQDLENIVFDCEKELIEALEKSCDDEEPEFRFFMCEDVW